MTDGNLFVRYRQIDANVKTVPVLVMPVRNVHQHSTRGDVGAVSAEALDAMPHGWRACGDRPVMDAPREADPPAAPSCHRFAPHASSATGVPAGYAWRSRRCADDPT